MKDFAQAIGAILACGVMLILSGAMFLAFFGAMRFFIGIALGGL